MNDDESKQRSVPHFSFTQLQMLLRCGFQYMFRYKEGLKERPNLPMANGSAGHLSLQLNNLHKIETQEDQSLEQILDNYSAEFTKQLSEFEKSDLSPADNPDATKDLTVQSLTIFRGKEAPKITPLSAEVEFLVPITKENDTDEPILPIKGFIDTIQKRERIILPNAGPTPRIEVIDYKFPSRKPSDSAQRAMLSDQLTMYDMVLSKAGKPPDDVGFMNFIPPTKTIPARIEAAYRPIEMMRSKARESRHARLIYKLRTAARMIRENLFMPTDDPKVCAWCGYRDRCQNSLVKNDYEAMLLRQSDK